MYLFNQQQTQLLLTLKYFRLNIPEAIKKMLSDQLVSLAQCTAMPVIDSNRIVVTNEKIAAWWYVWRVQWYFWRVLFAVAQSAVIFAVIYLPDE